MAAETPENDVFIVGTFNIIDPVTKLVRNENGPRINLTRIIRDMKFPQRLLKNARAPMKNCTNQRIALKREPKTGRFLKAAPLTNPSTGNEIIISTQNQNRNPEKEIVTTTRYLRNPINKSVSSAPPASPEVSNDESMLQRALEMSLKDSVPVVNTVIADSYPQEPNFSTMSEDEQMSYALKMSMHVNDHDYPILV